MDIQAAKKHIDILKSKLHKTRSNKRKIFLMSDIMSLEHFVQIYEPEYSSNIHYNSDFIYNSYKNKMLKERTGNCEEILEANKENNMLASHMLNEFEKANFIPFLFYKLKIIDKKRSYELLRDFMGYMGPLAIKKYNELIRNKSILTRTLDNSGGICWNFPTINKQVVESDEDNGIYNLMAIAHEIGHAIHFEKLNGIGRRRLEHNTFIESMSILFEEEFINFGIENGMDFDILRNYVYSQRIPESLSVKMASSLIDKDLWFFNGRTMIFDEFDLDLIDMQDDTYVYLAERFKDDLEYIEPLNYVIGFALTEKIHSESLNGKDALKEMLDILLKSELYTHKENMEHLGLAYFDFPNLKDNLIKNANNIVLKK